MSTVKIQINFNFNYFITRSLSDNKRFGQYIVLLLNGYRVTIRHSLFIDVITNRTSNTWEGRAVIPVDYLPPNVTKMNAYAIHGPEDNRIYESLYPVPFNSTSGPDL